MKKPEINQWNKIHKESQIHIYRLRDGEKEKWHVSVNV